ncbi:MAG: hypothetical protein Q7R76_01600 [Candidatus Woesearchaeota archaeon]|nr:hypothetical protein [Candidatus Woesearchaeota archaeon]
MGEKQKYIVKKISYEGYFNYRELFRILDFWQRDKFYDKREHRSEEMVTDKGKNIDLEFLPWKKYTDYFKGVFKIVITVQHMKEVEIMVRGEKRKMNHGSIDIQITGYLIVDYEGYWDRHPLLTFIRDIFDRYFNWYITKKYINMLTDHANDLYFSLSSYLNASQYKVE